MKTTIDNALRAYCSSDREREIFDNLEKYGSKNAASKHLNIHHSTITRTILAIEKEAARRGYSPDHDMTRPVPDGFHLKGTSTLYDREGQITQQWVKTNIDHERQMELLREAVAAMAGTIEPVAPIPAPVSFKAKLLNCYVITDYHLGMMAWGEETGADWDMKIAEKLLIDWFGSAISTAPNAERAVFAQLGDFLHWDGLDAVTPTSGHVLDADSRFQKIVRVAIRLIRQVISMLLEKHQRVDVLMAEGNHDLASSAWFREMFTVLYENEPRVHVINRPDPYYCVEHGQTSLFFHHGHKKRIDSVESVFAAKFRPVFGRTKFSYGHVGHLHHNVTKESNLMTMEQHRTLASPDAHSARGGYMSGRDAKVITYHSEMGEIGRVTIPADAILESRWAA